MRHQETKLTSADGLKLFAQTWQPDTPAKAYIALVHGLGEHSGRYAHVAAHLAQHGYATHTFDLRGHGRSPGQPRGYVNSFDDYLADVEVLLTSVKTVAKQQPIFLMGHSMGGAIATLYTITRQPNQTHGLLRGLVLSSAALKLDDSVPPILVKLSGVISKIAPTLPTMKIDTATISRDPEIVGNAGSDPLCYYGGTRARTGAELIRAISLIGAGAGSITLPIFLFHGTADKLTSPEGSKQVYAKVASADKTLKLYEGAYHETLNDLCKAQVLDDLTQWLDARV